MGRWTDGWMDGWTDGWMDGWVDGRMGGWMDSGWVDGQTDGWMDGWIGGREEGMEGGREGWMQLEGNTDLGFPSPERVLLSQNQGID